LAQVKPLFFRLDPLRTLLHLFFRFLYHQFAFVYDLVAWLVSFGHWNEWILEVVPFIKGTRTLEIGHGPGHLQRLLLNRNLVAVAMDESSQMGRLAKRNLSKPIIKRSKDTIQSDYAQINLTRGLAQELPFRDEAFDTVIATFPAEYIYEVQTLSEVKRCLSDGGRFIVLPVAVPRNWFLSWLFRVTNQAPSEALEIAREKLEEPFIAAGFGVERHILDLPSGTLIIIVASIPR